jgi:hypothetical protein
LKASVQWFWQDSRFSSRLINHPPSKTFDRNVLSVQFGWQPFHPATSSDVHSQSQERGVAHGISKCNSSGTSASSCSRLGSACHMPFSALSTGDCTFHTSHKIGLQIVMRRYVGAKKRKSLTVKFAGIIPQPCLR